jgi:hypothetical protein
MTPKGTPSGSPLDPHPETSTPQPGGDWVHEIRQWYFTGSRRLASGQPPLARNDETAPAHAEGLPSRWPPTGPSKG